MELSSYKIVPMDAHEEKHEVDEFMTDPLARVKDEYEGWIKYRKMHKDTGEERFRIASQQEFGHLLMAIEDFIHCIQKHHPDAEEAAEFNKMMSTISMVGI